MNLYINGGEFMGTCSEKLLDAIKIRYRPNPFPVVFIETGTYRGDSTAAMAHQFLVIHTIELAKQLHHEASARFADQSHITCHLGDSATILETLLPAIDEPVVVFLDAHYAGGVTSFGREEVPLMRELDLFQTRKHRDIIIVDDVRLIGKTGECGQKDNVDYPPMIFDWRHISLKKISSTVRKSGQYYSEQFGDQMVFLTNLSVGRIVLFRVLAIFRWPFVKARRLVLKVARKIWRTRSSWK